MLTYTLTPDLSINWGKDYIQVSGPKGCLIKRKSGFSLAIKEGQLFIWSKENSAQEGAYLSWLHHLIVGVTKGYRQKLRLVGVGYRASIVDKDLILKLGYSHEVRYPIPEDVSVTPAKGKGTLLLIKGIELQRVQQVAVEIRAFRFPDAYKGKGIHYYREVLRLKKGKREGK
jgi:large subunit ribosomal protein L6